MISFSEYRKSRHMYAGLDKEASYVGFIGLNKTLPLLEVYDGGSNDEYAPIGDEYVTHYEHSLASPSDSIKAYTSHLSGAINPALLNHYHSGNPEHIRSVKHHIEEIDNDLKHTTAKSDLILYSGLPESPIAKNGEWNHSRTSKIVHLPAYTSTSTNVHTATRFTGIDEQTKHLDSDHHGLILPNARHIVRISVPKGTTGVASARNFSTNTNENEFIMARGHSVEIHHRPTLLNKSYKDPVYMWHAHVFGYHPNPHKI